MTDYNQTAGKSLDDADMPKHKHIPMEKLDLIQPNTVRLLYYENPSCFYVYLRQRVQSHSDFQDALQNAMRDYVLRSPTLSIPIKYQRSQAVTIRDNHSVWHRATIIDVYPDKEEVRVYFVDYGEKSNLSITNVLPLPQEFMSPPAFAIPCRLYRICPIYNPDQPIWKTDDPVHDAFNQLMSNFATCKVCNVKEKVCYDVELDIPDVGDLGKTLIERKLVARTIMQPTQSTSDRIPPGFLPIRQPVRQHESISGLFSNRITPIPTTSFPTVQTLTVQPTNATMSSEIPYLNFEDGFYTITHIHNVLEFYAQSERRAKEYKAFSKHLADIYNDNLNDPSLSVDFLMEGIVCVAHLDEQYYRVVIKHRQSESEVLVKVIDRGDEILVHKSELLKIDKKYSEIHAFAQPLRLYNYDETHLTANLTLKFKRLVRNKSVQIISRTKLANGFYVVSVQLRDGPSVNEILLRNDANSIVPLSAESIESPKETMLNSINIQSITNDDSPVLAKLLAAPAALERTQPGRFNRKSPGFNELPSQYSRPEKQEESLPIGNQSQSSTFRAPNSQSHSSGTGFRNDEPKPNIDNQRSQFFSTRGRDNSRERPMNTSPQRTKRFDQRTNDYHDRNYDRRNENGDNGNEQNARQHFSRGGFRERGGRSNGFGDRESGRFHNKENDRNPEWRAGRRFPNNQDTGSDGNTGWRSNNRGNGQRGGRGNFSGRGTNERFRGHRGFSSGGSGIRQNNASPLNLNNDSSETFSGWPNVKPLMKRFDAGAQFQEQDIPNETFEFVVSHIETLNDFFIQLCSKEAELSNLSDQLQQEYTNAPDLIEAKANQICLAKYSDECWYRAIILSASLLQINVRFIDFGNTSNLEKRSLRQIEKQFCITPPYAYHCSLENFEVNESIDRGTIINHCAGRTFHSKILKKSSNNRYLLQSDDLRDLMISIGAIKYKPPARSKCRIVHIDKHEFYVQDNIDIMNNIDNEMQTTSDGILDDIKLNTMVVALFKNKPARAVIKEDLNENVRVYFVDYGHSNICSKQSLKICSEQLKAHPNQAKRCRLKDIPADNLDQAFKTLDEYINADNVEICIIDESDDLLNVHIYISGEYFDEKFYQCDTTNDVDDQSSTTTATTVKEQERLITSTTGKRNSAEILSPIGNSLSVSMNIKRQKSETEVEVNPIRYQKGILTYTDENQPYVYVQLLPESESNIAEINDIIEQLLENNPEHSSFKIDDLVIAQFPVDLNYYRARILSYCEQSQVYTVNFLDYGNTEKNILQNHLLSYPNELKQYEPQAHRYTVEQIPDNKWTKQVRKLFEDKINYEIEFYFTDLNQSVIHIKIDNEDQIYNSQPKTFMANISTTDHDCFYIHILPDANILLKKIDELLKQYPKESDKSKSWSINDLCIVYNNELNRYYRGKILSIHDNNTYNIRCIDHGNVLTNIRNDSIYALSDDDLLKSPPLARQCRLHGVDDNNQIKAIDEVIQSIRSDECLTITVENDQSDQCMNVMLFRANNDIVNDLYRPDENAQDTNTPNPLTKEPSDIAMSVDDDLANVEIMITKTDQQLTSPIGIPQAESTHQFGDLTSVTTGCPSPASSTVNQSIDFFENDPSTLHTTLRDDNESEHQPT